MPSGFKNRSRLLIPVLLPLLIMIGAAVWGRDFGYHWDESKMVPLIRGTIRTGTFLSGWYRYPSMTYWLNLLGLLPYTVGVFLRGDADIAALQAYLIDVAGGDIFNLQVRTIFIIVSSLSVLWVYLLILLWKNRNWAEALLAASFLALSWEVGYHLRWIAPDAILMQFGALTIMFAFLAVQGEKSRYWVWASAVAAGLGMGTKYPGGLLLVPVLIAAYRVKNRHGWGLILEVVLAFLGAYLLSTPGTLLEMRVFLHDVTSEVTHYQAGHYGYSLSPVEHFRLMGVYFSQVVFSHYPLLALFIFSLSLVGTYVLFEESRQDALLLLSFPGLYVLFFGFQRVMIVRNLLVLIPFLAVLSARGWFFLWQQLKNRSLRSLWAAAIVGVLVVNALWLAHSADTIRKRGSGIFVREFIASVRKEPESQFFISDKLWREIVLLDEAPPPNTLNEFSEHVDMVALYASEGMEQPTDWPRNKPGLVTKIFGPWETNFDYYPTWAGDDRILVMPLEKAQELNLNVIRNHSNE
ncbi:MAG: glycosyltransferase family 39 protein [Chloroflexota bacterium]|nr:glycosyltransferase family 39 protein [Chloroflexota bacterium]